MKLYRICGIGAFALALSLVACGDDSSSNSDVNGGKGEVITLADGSGEKVCDEMLEGWVAEAFGKDFRRCQNGEWTKITASEASAEEEIIGGVTELHSSSSTIEESSSSTKDPEPAEGSSSSTLATSSSSTTTSSSSAPTEDLVSSSSNNEALDLKIFHGTMADARDGHVYKTVTIGSQTWMAENLNFDYNEGSAMSLCYDEEPGNCIRCGRLYSWSAAMDSAGVFGSAGKDCGYGKTCNASGMVRGVCPEGWHLPSDDEWNHLWTAIGGTSVAGAKLKSTNGWHNDGNGMDSFGFAVLPAGYIDGFHIFNDKGINAYFWSSSENDSYYANHWYFGYDRDHVRRYNYDKNSSLSVRCLKDFSDKGNGAISLSSSSAKIEAESSSSVGKPNWQYLNPNIDYGEFTDARDNQIYKSVKIGSQTWMAENLNYAPVDVASMGEGAWSGCYNNEADSCAKYGRLYTWNVAMNNADCAVGKECNPSGNIQGVCPNGWHLPTKEEWKKMLEPLANSVDSEFSNVLVIYNGAGIALKTVDGWSECGTNSSGFSALPGGFWSEAGFDEGAYFWSASELDNKFAYSLVLDLASDLVASGSSAKSFAISVRCVQD